MDFKLKKALDELNQYQNIDELILKLLRSSFLAGKDSSLPIEAADIVAEEGLKLFKKTITKE